MKSFDRVAVALLMAVIPSTAVGGDLVLAEGGSSNHQIVVPDKNSAEIVDLWLTTTAKLMQATFEKNGFTVAIAKESARAQDKPCIYLGATEFAKKNGVAVLDRDDWSYQIKVVGKDLIIAGTDKADPKFKVRGTQTPLALLGTVKGACDFLRKYAGVRFLFLNKDQTSVTADGSLTLDTRSFGFLPVKRIAVADDLNLKKTPMMRANCDFAFETFHYIALNVFPMLSFVADTPVYWREVISREKYAKSHPEYFAMEANGNRIDPSKETYETRLCVTNKDVQELMLNAIEERIKAGAKTIPIWGLDEYALCRCHCDECNELFGMPARNWDEIHARGESGKLWQAWFAISDLVRAKYPDVKIVLNDYQDTPAKAVQRFPDNVILGYQYGSQRDFDRIKDVEIPGGICAYLEETFTGFGMAGPYLAERTPEHMAEVVQAQARNHVLWSSRDGSMGYIRGLQAPAYYVYGRMMDDPSADWQEIYKEFLTAAFGNVTWHMTEFFKLHDLQFAIYSDFFNTYMPAWNRKYARSRFHDSKWHVMSIYTPEYCAAADALLTPAEKTVTDPDIKARLRLIRIEFDYARGLSKIFFIQNAWTMNRSQENLTVLMDAIDGWHDSLRALSSGGKSTFDRLKDWPEMRPFDGHHYTHASLPNNGYQQQWADTCLNWDTKAIREGFLDDKHQLKVLTVDEAPGIDSKAWDDAPVSIFAERDAMPFTNVKTTMKVLRDKDACYVRIDSLFPHRHIEQMFEQKPDGDIFKQEYVELAIAPPDADGKVYRLTASPIAGARYDAVLSAGGVEDKSWNGTWEFEYTVNEPQGQWNLPRRVWTAWFKIPFSEFGGKAPAAGDVWRFNAARNRVDEYLLWKSAPKATDSNELGELMF